MRGQRLLVALLLLAGALSALALTRPAPVQASSMTFGRADHTTTALNDGRLLAVGGTSATAAEIYDPAADSWSLTGAMAFPRSGHAAVKLLDGRVLVLGGTGSTATGEIYDPASGRWSATAAAAPLRDQPGAAVLASGRVLVVGGAGSNASNALYDPATDSWAAVAPNLAGPRPVRPVVVALPDGRALVVGGTFAPPFAAELYDPASDSWGLVPLDASFREPTVTLLADGRVLITGAFGPTFALLFSPASGQITPAGSAPFALDGTTATLLADGRVLLVGWQSNGVGWEGLIYTPGLDRWFPARVPPLPRFGHSASLLPDGKVLLAGGANQLGGPFSSADLIDPSTAILDKQLFLPVAGREPGPYPLYTAAPLPTLPPGVPTRTPYVPTATPTRAGSVLIVDVILADPAFPDSEEYVEIRSASDTTLNLAGWRLVNTSRPDSSRGAVPAYQFPAFSLDPDVTVVVYSGVGDDDLEIGDFYWDRQPPIFKIGDRVELYNSGGSLIHSFVVPNQ